jgi:C-22 sterol desaturase
MLTLGARKILGDDCFVFFQGHSHKLYRIQLLPLFTRRALAIYIPIQEAVIKRFIADWLTMANDGKQLTVRNLVR